MSASPATSGSPSNARQGFKYAALVTAILVVIQAALAGRGWFVDYDLIKIHGYAGNVTFITGLLLVWFAYAGSRDGSLERADLMISIVMLVLVFAQFGLGYGGRDSQTARSLHIPNGVLITGATFALLTRAFSRRV